MSNTDIVEELLSHPATPVLVGAYLNPSRPFAGCTFNTLGRNPPAAFTADDLLALTTLDVRVRPLALRSLLDGSEPARVLGQSLAKDPVGLSIWDPDDAAFALAKAVWEALDSLPGIGPVIAGKLLARKRPGLIPIVDNVGTTTLQPSNGPYPWWSAFRELFADMALAERLRDLAPDTPTEVTPLRMLDIVIWVWRSQASTAKAARKDAAIVVDLGQST